MNNFWKEIWDDKGVSASTDLYFLDGCDHLEGILNSNNICKGIVSLLDITEGDSILEVGCGAGFLSREFTRSYKYTGIDYSQPIITKHKDIFPSHNVECGNANDIQFPDKHFDYVFCFGVYQYLPSYEYATKAIQEIIRVSKRGVLLGDLKETSTRPQHLPCPVNKIKELGFSITDPFYDSDDCNRYNAHKIWR